MLESGQNKALAMSRRRIRQVVRRGISKTFSPLDDTFNDTSFMHLMDGGLELCDRKHFTKLVHWKLSLFMELNQLWDELPNVSTP